MIHVKDSNKRNTKHLDNLDSNERQKVFCGTQRRERHSKHITINKKLHTTLKLSSSSSPKWFCNKLKNITGSRRQTNNISKDKWKTHFESLFSNHTQNDDNE